MTPRSKRYFALKQSIKYQESAIAMLMPIFDAYQLCIDKMKQIAKPIDKRPAMDHYRSGMAIIGEVGPELLIAPDGRSIITTSRIFPRMELPQGTAVFPESIKREGVFDVTVENPFTPFAKTTVTKVNDSPTAPSASL